MVGVSARACVLLPWLLRPVGGACISGEWDIEGSAPCDPESGNGQAIVNFLLQRKSRRTSESASAVLGRALAREKRVEGFSDNSSKCSLAFELLQSNLAAPLRNIQWLHFPKTGTSFAATLWNYACGSKVPLDLAVSPLASPTCQACYDMALKNRYPPEQYCQPGVFSEHFQTQHSPVSLLEMRKNSWQVVGLFRRPSQRLISAMHNGFHAAGFLNPEYKRLLEECSHRGEEAAACYVRFPGIAGCTARMLTGGQCAEPESDRSGQAFDGGRQRLPEALEMLKAMAFVGLTERWDESVCLFHRMFGGAVNTAQLVDFHSGGSHKSLYDEEVLNGFEDEVDEKIYRVAEQRFEELFKKYVGNSSACSVLQPSNQSSSGNSSNKLLQKSSEPMTCSCASEGRECGLSKAQNINCGNCPGSRLGFLKNQSDNSSKLRCEADSGRCMLGGKAMPELFSWSFKL